MLINTLRKRRRRSAIRHGNQLKNNVDLLHIRVRLVCGMWQSESYYYYLLIFAETDGCVCECDVEKTINQTLSLGTVSPRIYSYRI